MGGQDEVCAIRDEQPAAGLDARLGELRELFEQGVGVDHHAVAEQALLVVVDDPGGHEVEGEVPIAELDGVAGVVAALEADHGVERRAEQVDDLALALVAPLHAQNHAVRHLSRLPRIRGSVAGEFPKHWRSEERSTVWIRRES